MASMEDLTSLIMRLAENSQKREDDKHRALGINSYWGGTTSNASRAYDDQQLAGEKKRTDDLAKQKDLVMMGREKLANETGIANLQHGQGGSADRGYQAQRDVAGIGLEGRKYLADTGLQGQQYVADQGLKGHQYQADSLSEMNANRDALQFRKQDPEEMAADRSTQITKSVAAAMAANGKSDAEISAFIEKQSGPKLDFSAMNPSATQPPPTQTGIAPVGYSATKQTPMSPKEIGLAKLASGEYRESAPLLSSRDKLPTMPEPQPGFFSALQDSNQRLNGKLLDPLGLNKRKKSTNPLFPNYEQ